MEFLKRDHQLITENMQQTKRWLLKQIQTYNVRKPYIQSQKMQAMSVVQLYTYIHIYPPSSQHHFYLRQRCCIKNGICMNIKI